MILNDREIRELITSGSLVIDPFEDSLINPCSLDYRLGNKFGVVRCKQKVETDGVRCLRTIDLPINPLDPTTFDTVYVETNEYLLGPGELVIASSLERMGVPNDIAMYAVGKSSMGRLGVANSVLFAGWIDPEFPGYLTLEIVNLSRNTVKLTAGMKIGQFLLFRCNPPDKSYKETGRYVDQGPAAGSKGI